jgi:hypothetical protein
MDGAQLQLPTGRPSSPPSPPPKATDEPGYEGTYNTIRRALEALND